MQTALASRNTRTGGCVPSVLFAAGAGVLWLAVSGLTAVPAAAQTPELRLIGAGGQPVTAIEIDLRQEDDSGSAQFFMRQDTSKAAVSVVLSAVLTQGTITFSEESFVVPPAPRQVHVAITVQGLARGGIHSAAIVASTDSGSVTIGRVVIRKDSELSILGTGADGIELTHPVPEFTRAFKVVSSAPAEIAGVTLFVDEFLSPASVASPAVVTVDGRPYDGEPFMLPPLSSYTFTVSATLPGAGTHTSQIFLTRGDERISTKLAVTRTNVPPTVSVDSLNQVEVARGILGGAAEAPLRIALRETGGREQILAIPALVSLVRKDGVRRPSTDGTLEVDTADFGDEVRLNPYESRVVEARLTGLKEAGEITGTIRFMDGTSGVIDRQITLFVRDSPWWAFVAILIGVFVSAWLRHWLTVRRERLLDRYEAATIEEELRGLDEWLPAPPPAGARSLIGALRAYVWEVSESTSGPLARDIDAQLTDLREKTKLLRRWIRAALLAESLAVRGKHTTAFSAVRRVLESRDTDEAARTDAANKLATLMAALDAESGLPFDALERAVDALLDTAVSGTPEAQALTKQKERLDEAREAIAGGDPARAEALVGDVRSFLGDHQLLNVRDLLAGIRPPPGMSEDGWTALRGRLTVRIEAAEALGSEAKVDEADRIMSSLLGEVIPGLQRRMRSKANANQSKDEDLAEAIRTAADRLDGASSRLADGEVGAAAAIYRAVLREYVDNHGPRLVQHGDQMSGRREQNPLAVPGALGQINRKPAPDTASLPPSKLPSRHKLGAQITLEGAVVWLALAVIAVVIGMNLLYVNDLSWGGWGDWMVAVLWGLGVHAVGDNKFGGVGGLRAQFAPASDD